MLKLLCFLLLLSIDLNAKILMKPYLQALTDSSVIVMIECDNEKSAVVEYNVTRRNDHSLIQKAITLFSVKTDAGRKATYVHRILLTGLTSSTVYQYRAIHESDTTDLIEFKSAAKSSNNAYTNIKVRMAVMGDCRSNKDMHHLLALEIAKRNPDFSVYLGDLCFSSKYASWKEEFFVDAELDLISKVPFFNSVGNHEGWKQNTWAFQQTPCQGEPCNYVGGKDMKPWYSVTYANVLILVLSTLHDCDPGSEQWNFAKQVLEDWNRLYGNDNASKNAGSPNTGKIWKFVAIHHPAYCYGGHGENNEMIRATKELFEPNGIDFVLGGHSHFYQHNKVNNIRHMVFGGGGAPLATPEKSNYTLKSVRDYNYAIFDFDKNKLKMTVYDIHSNILDELILEK